jgi:NDP-sugar pyrophosphorylase family protein
MKAVIMAGGEGTRLRPLTSNQPKPMLPMANVPMMEHVVNLLRTHGFEDIVVTVAFMANAIRTYFGDGSEFGVRMVYATEETPLGTAGSVRNARDELDERFLVISGDVLTDIDLSEVVGFHQKRGAMATLALKAVDNPLEFGIVITQEDGSVERFLEKPTWGQVFSDTINTGIFVLEPEIFDFIPEGRPVDFSGETFPAVLEAEKPLYGYVADGYWEDVGTLAAYLKSRCRSRGSRSAPVCGWARAPRSTPRCPLPARRSSATTASSAPGRDWASTAPSGRTSGWGTTRRCSDRSSTTTPTWVPGCASREACWAGAPISDKGCGARKASCWATSASWAPTPSSGRA